MPYIQTRTNVKIDKEKELRIKERLGRAISLLGKSEDWLMIEFVPECNMYFGGDNNRLIAYVDIKIYGHGTRDSFNNMTREVTNILNEELGIDSNNVYVSYGEFDNWGFNGANF